MVRVYLDASSCGPRCILSSTSSPEEMSTPGITTFTDREKGKYDSVQVVLHSHYGQR